MNKKNSLFAVAGMALMMATQAHAQGTQFTPGILGGTGATNPNGSFIHPSGLAQDGNPNQFIVGGTIAEFIEITAIDSNLELGDLGSPQNRGWVASVNPTGNPGVLPSGDGATGTPSFVTQSGVNGTAGVELDSNAYIRVQADYSNDITNRGPDNASGGGDDFTIPTRYRIAAKGREFRLGNATTPSNSPTAYTSYGSAVGSLNSSSVTYSPGAGSGLKIMSEVQRDGLNNYRGQYTSKIDVQYFKF